MEMGTGHILVQRRGFVSFYVAKAAGAEGELTLRPSVNLTRA